MKNGCCCKLNKLCPIRLGFAGGLTMALCLILTVLLANAGHNPAALEILAKTHAFFAPTLAGTIAGAIESFVHGFIFFALVAFFYDCCLKHKSCEKCDAGCPCKRDDRNIHVDERKDL